ncbi:hypothetical protein [Virgibacillus alimentarius]|uniref:50S ribosomal protein L33 n=1 Tax=Virgibacillus alimentarius TaxID=698769 RepID=A0ABS4SB88_9BACI|nr:hypothetical protein [Virgibacillus alimentarius]MBP2258777.1 hypothetical protein [Virgibacillus alimentarius]
MRCGAKCFLVQIEANGENQMKFVNARTPAEARKIFRRKYGTGAQILSVREKKR